MNINLARCWYHQKILSFDDASAIYLFTLEKKRHRDLLRKIQGPILRGGKGKGKGRGGKENEEMRAS